MAVINPQERKLAKLSAVAFILPLLKTKTVGMLVKFMLNTNSIIGECTALNKFQLHICSG